MKRRIKSLDRVRRLQEKLYHLSVWRLSMEAGVFGGGGRSVKRLRLNCEGVSRRIGGFVHDFGRWRKGRASGVVGQGVQLADRRSVSNIRQRICDGCAAVGVG